MIESTLDLEAAKENEFIIRPDFDEELQSVFQFTFTVSLLMKFGFTQTSGTRIKPSLSNSG